MVLLKSSCLVEFERGLPVVVVGHTVRSSSKDKKQAVSIHPINFRSRKELWNSKN
jgi:hypothetical protein